MWCLPRFLPRKPGVDERKPGVGGQAPRIRIQRSLKVHQTEYRDTPPALSPVSRRDYRRYVYRTLRQRTSTAGLQMWVTCNAYERRAATGYSNLQYHPHPSSAQSRAYKLCPASWRRFEDGATPLPAGASHSQSARCSRTFVLVARPFPLLFTKRSALSKRTRTLGHYHTEPY